jgi:hypothetical protein
MRRYKKHQSKIVRLQVRHYTFCLQNKQYARHLCEAILFGKVLLDMAHMSVRIVVTLTVVVFSVGLGHLLNTTVYESALCVVNQMVFLFFLLGLTLTWLSQAGFN